MQANVVNRPNEWSQRKDVVVVEECEIESSNDEENESDDQQSTLQDGVAS